MAVEQAKPLDGTPVQKGIEDSGKRKASGSVNPVVATSRVVYEATNLVRIDDEGVKDAARLIYQKLLAEAYTPRTWRTHSLHILPPEPYDENNPQTKQVLDWIFLISALNFSFWSELEGTPERYGVEWRTGWGSEAAAVHTGYWSLVAALNRAIEEDIPITDPCFYASEKKCPDSLLTHVFRPAAICKETIPLLLERISVMREVGIILTNSFGGSFQGFLREFHRRYDGQGSAIDLVKMVVETFPCFKDESLFHSTKVHLWKRPQILVAETWAAFFPLSPSDPHPIFPGARGPQISELTMFADYRVPQILHHLRILSYPDSLVEKLQAGVLLPSGCREELSLRTSSIIAVERVQEEILALIVADDPDGCSDLSSSVSSVLIDFFLWDLAKRVESGEEEINGIETHDMVPIHRTRSIWY
ncbi:hypothetical protein FA15DRAFT_756229 [Coprinopsis marcescibilis]|uniref:Queuosine 5'-phosphate N-glycosylase/hydrolase n=1 Tax=Coprinopsis marcescibilis TaxID=230819 RepID=A0A5C3KWZ4_COPMA|nr:hypothetical protein FA15DRAFT_756229 [Coprinopsis marcescibilis]